VLKYGQYCPVAKALEILGDRWTLLIVRDLLMGTRHFNELERGLPRISRALLSARLRQLQRAGVIEKWIYGSGRRTTEYQLTQAGLDLLDVISALRVWGEAWAFGEPTPEDLDPVLLMWRMRKRVNLDRLPEHRVVVQYDLHGAAVVTLWLVMTKAEATLCLTDPGFQIDVLVTADLAALFKLQAERITYQAALKDHDVHVEGVPSLTRAFPHWFGWSTAALVENGARGSNGITDEAHRLQTAG
jgi:DNA-binding HxlR family transcriptional regulator